MSSFKLYPVTIYQLLLIWVYCVSVCVYVCICIYLLTHQLENALKLTYNLENALKFTYNKVYLSILQTSSVLGTIPPRSMLLHGFFPFIKIQTFK